MIYILSQKRYEGATNLPSIMIDYRDEKIDLKGVEALIFSSKNGVMALDRVTPLWRDIPAYAIGSATQEAIEALGGRVVYRAKNSYGDAFAKEIRERLNGKVALFLRPLVVTSSLNTILTKAGVLLKEVVLYETKCTPCKNLKAPEKGAIMIFSSPSTIRCFFHCFSWDASYQAVVIGDVTASYMPKDVPFAKASQPTIPACIELANRLSKKAL